MPSVTYPITSLQNQQQTGSKWKKRCLQYKKEIRVHARFWHEWHRKSKCYKERDRGREKRTQSPILFLSFLEAVNNVHSFTHTLCLSCPVRHSRTTTSLTRLLSLIVIGVERARFFIAFLFLSSFFIAWINFSLTFRNVFLLILLTSIRFCYHMENNQFYKHGNAFRHQNRVLSLRNLVDNVSGIKWSNLSQLFYWQGKRLSTKTCVALIN